MKYENSLKSVVKQPLQKITQKLKTSLSNLVHMGFHETGACNLTSLLELWITLLLQMSHYHRKNRTQQKHLSNKYSFVNKNMHFYPSIIPYNMKALKHVQFSHIQINTSIICSRHWKHGVKSWTFYNTVDLYWKSMTLLTNNKDTRS